MLLLYILYNIVFIVSLVIPVVQVYAYYTYYIIQYCSHDLIIYIRINILGISCAMDGGKISCYRDKNNNNNIPIMVLISKSHF